MSDYYALSAATETEDTLPLFATARQPARDTRIAAVGAAGKRSSAVAARIRDFLRRCGARGATDEEIRTALELGESTARPRRSEMAKCGKVVDSGDRRASSKGCAMIVWVLAEFASSQTADK